MNKPRIWFFIAAFLALLWNLAGLFAVVSDLRLSPNELAAMSPEQQALYAARPIWSVMASVLAVAGGTAGCAGLLLRWRRTVFLFYASLVGIVFQDLGLFVIMDTNLSGNIAAYVMQSIVFLIAIGLIWLAGFASKKSWLR